MTAVTAQSPAASLRPTLIGVGAILLWSTLAPLTALTGAVPPFQMVAIAFSFGALVGLAAMIRRGRAALEVLRQPPRVWLLGVGGLFGFHFLYFLALRSAPAVEANLINYLWPLLVVLFATLLPGERLSGWHCAGAGVGLAGTALLIAGPGSLALSLGALPGYAAALASAVIWAGYSVLSRRLGHVPTEAVAGFCLVTAVLAALCHAGLETTSWPQDPAGWAALPALGLGPVGVAFYLWDHGVKRGDIKLLGSLSYAAPPLSTLILVAMGRASGSWTLWVACALIVGGALLAGRAVAGPRRTASGTLAEPDHAR